MLCGSSLYLFCWFGCVFSVYDVVFLLCVESVFSVFLRLFCATCYYFGCAFSVYSRVFVFSFFVLIQCLVYVDVYVLCAVFP